MSPLTHLLASWLIAAKTTAHPRDCRLVALAGLLPDADGLGVVGDLVNAAAGRPVTYLYAQHHHFLLHGLFGAMLIAIVMSAFARDRLRVFGLALIVFHLHLLCDLAGSRGPDKLDLWPIFYLGPFSKEPMWLWKGQWALDAWPNRLLSAALFLATLWLPVRLGHSVVGVFNRRADAVFVGILRKWHRALAARLSTTSGGEPRHPDQS